MKPLIGFVFFAGLLILAAPLATAAITFTPSNPNVEQTVYLPQPWLRAP